jgi:hypothetical protein
LVLVAPPPPLTPVGGRTTAKGFSMDRRIPQRTLAESPPCTCCPTCRGRIAALQGECRFLRRWILWGLGSAWLVTLGLAGLAVWRAVGGSG